VADWNTGSFEDLYASVGDDLARVAWARLGPYPMLVEWLDRRATTPGGRALVVACGLGDDAEELGGRGYEVTAFDLSETAISWCHRRFPDSPVDYQIADLLELPREWAHRFDLVVEINTIQSLPLAVRERTVSAIASTVAPGGALFVRCVGRADDEPVGSRPWPVSREELAVLEQGGLRETEFAEDFSEPARRRWFQAVYERIL
jgi:SAM-dependent methyltransferase